MNLICFIIIIYLFIIYLIIYKLYSKNYIIENFLQPPKYVNANTKHIFWTGGFDSTFRLCQALITEGRAVQPIYVTYKYLDNTIGYQNKNGFRSNKTSEIRSMDIIRRYINIKFPQVKNRFFPTMYISNIPENQQITNSMYNLHYTFGKFSRPITQYERLARFSLYYPYPIDVSTENTNTGMDNATRGIRIGYGTSECRVPTHLKKKFKDFKILSNLRFPIVHLTKNEMLEIAIKGQYDDILKMTWSCWYPQNGEPCGKCDMCSHRIIPQYNTDKLYINHEKIQRDQKTIDNSLNIKYIYYE
jgi:hypothetical protein